MHPILRAPPLSPLLLLIATVMPGEDAAPPNPTPPTPTVVEAPAPSEAVPAAPSSDGRFALEFRGARLGQVLDYLAKEAGFILTGPALELSAPITLVAKQPVTPSEALDALNGVLVEQGYAAIVRGKSLRVVTLSLAKQQNLPVQVGADPERIPDSDRMVTQIIPIQFATAKDLAENLQPLLNPSTATLAANESSNLLILTDTQSNVRRIVSIVQAIDTSVSGELEVKVFHLAHAAADKAATIINTIYGKNNSSSSSNRNGNNNFDPMARMFGGGGGGQGSNNNQNTNGKASGRGVDVNAAADTGTNSLVVRAAPSAMKAISQVVTQLDLDTSASDGVLLYRVRNAKAADLASALTNLFQGTKSSTSSSSTNTSRTTTQNRSVPTPAAAAPTGGANSTNTLDLTGQVMVVAETTSNSVLVLSPERNFDRLRRILEELDQPMRQVLVRVLVAEMTIEDGSDFGVELAGVNPTGATDASRLYSSFTLSDNTVGVNGFLLNSNNFQATVHALASTSRFDVLSRPYILTTDNQQATVNVTQEVPVVTGSRTDVNNNLTTTFTREEVGIILKVTPQINSDGRVVLVVDQELSALTDQTMQVAKDVTSPIIKKRTMTTKVTMDKGQTVVVGGLVSDTTTETVSKVPFLGDIPYLGVLFSRTKRNKAKTEMLMFLTPQVVQSAEDLNAVSAQARSDMKHLNSAVENDLLQAHLDDLMATKVGSPLTVKPVRTASPHSSAEPPAAVPTQPAAAHQGVKP